MSYLNSRTTKTPENDDFIYYSSNDGASDRKSLLSNVTVIPETTRTINLNSSMTRDDIQDEINAVGKFIPRGITITFQFANGTYNLDNVLTWSGFYGGGNIYIQGDTTQTNGLHTNQNVHLNFTGISHHGIYLLHNANRLIIVEHIKITHEDGFSGLIAQRCKWVHSRYNYFLGVDKTSGGSRGLFYLDGTDGRVEYCYVSNNYRGIQASVNAHLSSENNDDTGTQPRAGLRADGNGVIGKQGTQPTGTNSNEEVGQGGEIRS